MTIKYEICEETSCVNRSMVNSSITKRSWSTNPQAASPAGVSNLRDFFHITYIFSCNAPQRLIIQLLRMWTGFHLECFCVKITINRRLGLSRKWRRSDDCWKRLVTSSTVHVKRGSYLYERRSVFRDVVQNNVVVLESGSILIWRWYGAGHVLYWHSETNFQAS